MKTITNYWYDGFGTAYYKKDGLPDWRKMNLPRTFFIRDNEKMKKVLKHLVQRHFKSAEKFQKSVDIINGYVDIYGQPLIGFKFKPTQTKKYNLILKDLKSLIFNNHLPPVIDNSIFGENIFRFGLLVDPNIKIDNSDARIWFLDIEIDNFSEENKNISISDMVTLQVNKIISITIYDTIEDKYIQLVVDPKGKKQEKDIYKENKSVAIVKDETDLLKYFLKLFRKYSPYVISGWYSNSFDIPYLIKRITNTFNNGKELFSLIKDLDCGTIDRDKRGEIIRYNKIPGVELLDYMDLYLKYSGKTPPSKSLDGIAKFEKIGGKTEAKGFKYYFSDFNRFLDYIFTDVEILVELENKMKLVRMVLGLQELVKIPLSTVLQTSRVVESMIYHSTYPDRIVIPSYVHKKDINTYQGAMVLDSEDKTFNNVVVLDYASLYPNVMLTFNISPETLVVGEEEIKELNRKKIPYIDFTGILDKGESVAYKLDETGIIPKQISMLISQRMKYKKLYKKTPDSDPNKKEYDLKQWNYKIIINSIYGYMGYRFSPLLNFTVAESITAQARYMLKTCIDLVNNSSFGTRVIYGDSVQGDSKIVIKNGNKIKEIKIKDLFSNVDYKQNDKEYNNCSNVEVLTMDENGNSVFKPIKYVMRHKTNKQVYRVGTSNINFVDVTEDHSIITMDRNMNMYCSKPTDIDSKQKLIVNNKTPYQINSKNYSKELYEFLGLFLGDGSIWKTCGRYYYCSISQGKDLNEIIEKILMPLQQQGWIKNFWVKSKNDITINGLKLIRLIQNECLNDENIKKIPDFIFNETLDNIGYFISGLFQADGTVIIRNNTPIVRFTNTNMSLIEGSTMLLNQIGISNSYFTESNFNKYKGKKSKAKSSHLVINNIEKFKSIGLILDRKNQRIKDYKRVSLPQFVNKDFSIKRLGVMNPIEYNDYVYDIEVEDLHRFYANGILVHNTDSAFSVLNNYKDREDATKEEIEKVQHNLSKYVNEQIPEHIFQHFHNIPKDKIRNTLTVDTDKIFKKLRMFGVKKRYYGLDFNDKEIFQGIELIRSDTPESIKPLLSKFFKKQLYNELTEEDLVNEYENIKQLPLEDIGTSKGVTQIDFSQYKVIPGHVRGIIFAKQIGVNVPDVLTDKVLQIPINIYRQKNEQLFDKAKEIFNINRKTITEISCVISVTPELIEETENVINSLNGFITIDYLTFYNKQVLDKLKQFSNLTNMIDSVIQILNKKEYQNVIGKTLELFG